jgi:hypothetical protein
METPKSMTGEELSEDTLWRDAWRIAWVGAANPAACAATLAKYLSWRNHQVGTAEVGNHPAIQAIAGHMACLIKMPGYALGPSDESLKAVQENAIRLGVMDEKGNYL